MTTSHHFGVRVFCAGEESPETADTASSRGLEGPSRRFSLFDRPHVDPPRVKQGPHVVDLESGEPGIIHRQQAAVEGEHGDAVAGAVEDPSPELFALTKCLLGLLAFGRVDRRPEHPERLPPLVAEHCSTRGDPADLAARAHDPELDAVGCVLVDRPSDTPEDAVHVVRMDESCEVLEATPEGPRPHAVDRVDPIGPGDTLIRDVPLPGADLARLHRQAEAFLVHPHRLLRPPPFGHVGEEVQCAAELAAIVHQRASRHDRPDPLPVLGAEADVDLLADTGPPMLEQLASPRLVLIEHEIPHHAAEQIPRLVAEDLRHSLD